MSCTVIMPSFNKRSAIFGPTPLSSVIGYWFKLGLDKFDLILLYVSELSVLTEP
ncbi:hypothetical protein PCA01_36960 [Pseudoalteromonas carrageenovora]|nr:hypothetical protein PCA01_36960 [Pseudoalteromonas carrageenovora]